MSSLQVDVVECLVNVVERLMSGCGAGLGRYVGAGVDRAGCPVCGVEYVVLGGLLDDIEGVGGGTG